VNKHISNACIIKAHSNHSYYYNLSEYIHNKCKHNDILYDYYGESIYCNADKDTYEWTLLTDSQKESILDNDLFNYFNPSFDGEL
tara:strand:+ start:414 stop:668 length:255 start_codon:yes stop_codon:yes gene_type:complete